MKFKELFEEHIMRFVQEVKAGSTAEEFVAALQENATDPEEGSNAEMALEMILSFTDYENFIGMMVETKEKIAKGEC